MTRKRQVDLLLVCSSRFFSGAADLLHQRLLVSGAQQSYHVLASASAADPCTMQGPEPQGSRYKPLWWSLAAVPIAAAWALTTGSASSAKTANELPSSPAAAAAAETASLLHDTGPAESFHFFSLMTRQRLFFTYEKRIRDMSSLDKVFDYFSSQSKDNFHYMLPSDLLNAVVPTYPASRSAEERAGALPGERRPQIQEAMIKSQKRKNKFFQKFDLDGDGLLAFPEFQLVVTLLSIPEEDVNVVFDAVDLDGNGTIDAAEFDAIMKLLQIKARTHSFRHSTTQAGVCGNSGLIASFFGPDLKGRLQPRQFLDFLVTLRRELIKLEFQHYQPDEHHLIPGLDFARSLVVAADMNHVEGLLNQVQRCAAELQAMDISFSEFDSVHMLQQKLRAVKTALEFMDKIGRPISQSDLSRVVSKFAGIDLSDQVLTVMMIVFDNGKGKLDTPRFVDAMRRKGHFWARRVNAVQDVV